VQHWLIVASAWGDPKRSWSKVSEAVRTWVAALIQAMDHRDKLERTIVSLCQVVAKTCRRDPRSKPGTEVDPKNWTVE
jgi:hypothetical protein